MENRMKNKLNLLSIILLIQIVFLSNSYGESENSHNDEINVLLQDENTSNFLTNERGQDFHDNFRDLSKLSFAENNILIKKNTIVRLDGGKLPEFSTIFIEGELKIINTDDSVLRVQKIIIAHGGKLTIGTEELPIKSDDKPSSPLNSKKGNGTMSGINKQIRKYVRAYLVAFNSFAIRN